nr:TnsD family Tn7-like transposition protein [uncultured Pseudogulbenkiania sp.]
MNAAVSHIGLDCEEKSFLPRPYLDETLYSWCSRFHLLNGKTHQETSWLLFGHSTAGLRHDLPFHLVNFQMSTSEKLGSLREILLYRTILGFHVNFVPTTVEQQVVLHLANGNGAKAHNLLGLKRSGMKLVNPLRACPECVSEQIRDHGVSWWSALQQWPSEFLCRKHGEWLRVATTPMRRGTLLGFYLPSNVVNCTWESCKKATAHQKNQMSCIAELGKKLCDQSGIKLSDLILRYCYMLQAKSLGWLAFDGSVRLHQLRDAFMPYYREIAGLFDEELICEKDGINAGFLTYLFRQYPNRRHPLKHILLINFLFDDSKEFIALYSQIKEVFVNDGEKALHKMLCDGQHHLLDLVSKQSLSVNRAAAAVGVSVSSATKFLDRHGITHSRRPRIVGSDRETQLIQLLKLGLDRREIAQRTGVRQAFIKDYLACHTDLRDLWRKENKIKQRGLHRKQLMTTLQNNPELPIKSIRLLPSNGFQWIYNHDRAWLQEILPAIWKR